MLMQVLETKFLILFMEIIQILFCYVEINSNFAI